MESDRERALLTEMSDRFKRLEIMVASLHPTDEADPGKAELIANLKQELEALRSAVEELTQALDD